jgi:hypothetical protein
MVEVNAEWRFQDPALADNTTPVSFTNEAERIAMHLHLVRNTLAARTSEGLSAGQAAERSELLGKLERYADRGIFPQNHVLPYRNPVFIDPIGTACAVGQLMIESGHADLAHRIDTEMELYYVHDMHRADVDAWAVEHGFNEDELAWIQPGYAPTIPWVGVGGGTNGRVTAMMALASGNLLVAGDFTEAGGDPVNRIAFWNGVEYIPLGGELEGTINCMVMTANGDLYVGGNMLNGMHDLARLSFNTWTYSTVFDGKFPNITALHVHNGSLYAAGDISGFAGIEHRVMRQDGDYWTPMGSFFNAEVLALGSHDGKLVAGGMFLGLGSPTDPVIDHIAVFEGNEWMQLGDGLDAPVRTLMDVNGTLYAGGDLFANVAPTFGLASIAPSATTWDHLLPNLADYTFPGTGTPYIGSLALDAGEVYFGGSFYMAYGMTFGTNIARYNGIPDDITILSNVEAPVNAVAVTGDDLYIGGDFETTLPHIAKTDISTGMDDPDHDQLTLRIAPNPTVDIVTVQLPEGFSAAALLRATDAQGRIIELPVQRSGDNLRVDASGLASGNYTLEMTQNGRSATGRFVKQ